MEEKSAPFLREFLTGALLGKTAMVEASGAVFGHARRLLCCPLNLDSDARLILRR